MAKRGGLGIGKCSNGLIEVGVRIRRSSTERRQTGEQDHEPLCCHPGASSLSGGFGSGLAAYLTFSV